ncbi:hypothetical protein KRMM14A1004_47010 [Krasilnikovia sp. MM14-A1004]
MKRDLVPLGGQAPCLRRGSSTEMRAAHHHRESAHRGTHGGDGLERLEGRGADADHPRARNQIDEWARTGTNGTADTLLDQAIRAHRDVPDDLPN